MRRITENVTIYFVLLHTPVIAVLKHNNAENLISPIKSWWSSFFSDLVYSPTESWKMFIKGTCGKRLIYNAVTRSTRDSECRIQHPYQPPPRYNSGICDLHHKHICILICASNPTSSLHFNAVDAFYLVKIKKPGDGVWQGCSLRPDPFFIFADFII